MVWLIDDLAEAALGPWGLAMSVGIGVAGLARRTFAADEAVTPAGTAPIIEGTSIPVASVPTIDRSTPSGQSNQPGQAASSTVSAVTGRIAAASTAASATVGAAVGRLGGTLSRSTGAAGARVQGATASAKGRVQTALAEVGDYWQNLYAEAHAEWEQGRTAPASASASVTAAGSSIITAGPDAPTAGVILDTAGEPISPGARVRGANGRYSKETV